MAKDAKGHGSDARGDVAAAAELAQGHPKSQAVPVHVAMVQRPSIGDPPLNYYPDDPDGYAMERVNRSLAWNAMKARK